MELARAQFAGWLMQQPCSDSHERRPRPLSFLSFFLSGFPIRFRRGPGPEKGQHVPHCPPLVEGWQSFCRHIHLPPTLRTHTAIHHRPHRDSMGIWQPSYQTTRKKILQDFITIRSLLELINLMTCGRINELPLWFKMGLSKDKKVERVNVEFISKQHRLY